MKKSEIGIISKSHLLVLLLVINSTLFPISLLNIVSLKLGESIIFIIRGISVLFLFIVFLTFQIRKIKIPKNYLLLLIFSSLQLGIWGTIHKYYIDFILLINFALVFYNIDDEEKNKFLRYSAFTYFSIITLFTFLHLIGINLHSYVGQESFVETQIVSSIGFKNPNSFSYCLFVSNFLFYKTRNFLMFMISSALILFTYSITGTVSTLIGLFLIILYSIILKYYKGNINRLLSFAIFIFITIITLVFYFLDFVLENSFGNLVPRVLGLIEFKETVSSNLKILLFGGQTAKFDTFYTNFILGVGILTFFVLVVASIKSAQISIKRNDYMSFFIIIIVLSLGVIENILYSSSPLSILYIGVLFTYGKNLQYHPNLKI